MNSTRRTLTTKRPTSPGFACIIGLDTELGCGIITNLRTGVPEGIAISINEATEIIDSRKKHSHGIKPTWQTPEELGLFARGLEGTYHLVAKYIDGRLDWTI
jgi:hypothetical protein